MAASGGASPMRRTVLALGLALLVVATAGVVGTAGPASPTPDDRLDGATATGSLAGTDAPGQVDPTGQANTTGQASSGTDAVHSALAGVSGDTEMVVRFREARETPGVSTASTRSLEAHARDSQTAFERFADRTEGVEVRNQFWIANAMHVEVDVDAVPLERLTGVENVDRVHPNFEVQSLGATATSPTAPTMGLQTNETVSPSSDHVTDGLEMINATAFWDEYDSRGEGVNVTVLDTGVDADHDDIEVDEWAEFDYETGLQVDSDPHDKGEHGTHVAGTMTGGNASGTHIGVAPEATHHHGLVLSEESENGMYGSFTQILSGMEWATDEVDTDILSMSLGSTGYGDGFIEPVQNARDSGTLVVAASGNTGEGYSDSPANVYDSLSVGAVGEDGDVRDFSNGEVVETDLVWDDPPWYWPENYTVPDVTAPGSFVYSAVPGQAYDHFHGTSMATPHVAGAAALLLSYDDSLGVDDVENRLQETADYQGNDVRPDPRYGYGLIDVYTAAQDGTITGSVVDARDGTPLEDATVTADGAEERIATTDGDGEFSIADVEPADGYTVTADTNGFESNSSNLDVEIAGQHEVNFSLEPEPADVDGTITDARTDAGVENASVTLVDDENGSVAATVTDTSGDYAVEGVDPGTGYTVDVEVDGYSDATSESLALDPGASEAVDFALDPHVISGKVNDSFNDSALDDATVTVIDDEDTVASAPVNETGHYTLSALPAATDYNVTADAPDFESATAEDVSVGEASHPTLDFELDAEDGGISGTVTDAVTDDPVANATVNVTGQPHLNATASMDGTYTIDDVPRGDDYELEVTVDDYDEKSAMVDIAPGEDVIMNVSLVPHDGVLEGAIVSNATNEAIEDSSITLVNDTDTIVNETETGSDGVYEFDPVDRDDGYVLEVDHGVYQNSTTSIEILPNETHTETVFLEPEPATISGTIHGNGTVLEDASVTVNESSAVTTTDADGAYEFDAPAERDLTVDVSAPGYNRNDSMVLPAFEPAGAQSDVNVTLEQRPNYVSVEIIDAPTEIDEGDDFDVEATVTNLGYEVYANATVEFVSSDDVVAERELDLNASEESTLTFDHSIDEEGTYDLWINSTNESASTTVVVEGDDSNGGGGGFFPSPDPEPDPEPDVSVGSKSVDATTVAVGETVTVTVSLTNEGDADGSHDLSLTVDGSEVDATTATVPAGESVDATLSAGFDEAGSYDLAVDGVDVATVEVEPEEPAADDDGDDGAADETGDADADDADDEDDGASDDDGADSTPGFGVVATAVAILGGALLARRRG